MKLKVWGECLASEGLDMPFCYPSIGLCALGLLASKKKASYVGL